MAQRRLKALAAHVATAHTVAKTETSAAVELQPAVEPIVPQLKDTGRDAALPGTGPSTRSVTIRQLRPEDEAAYCAFGGRATWRDGWHYPLFGMPGDDTDLRECARRQGQPASYQHFSGQGGGGEMRLVLVETRTEEYDGKVYSWDEIYGEGWYSWGSVDTKGSVFGLSVNTQFQGSGAGRALITRVPTCTPFNMYT